MDFTVRSIQVCRFEIPKMSFITYYFPFLILYFAVPFRLTPTKTPSFLKYSYICMQLYISSLTNDWLTPRLTDDSLVDVVRPGLRKLQYVHWRTMATDNQATFSDVLEYVRRLIYVCPSFVRRSIHPSVHPSVRHSPPVSSLTHCVLTLPPIPACHHPLGN